MVNEAQQNPSDTLANPPISTVERNRLSDKQVKSIHNITEEQFPIALKRTSQSHTSGLTLEHATWRPQKPPEVTHDSENLSRFANRERDHVSRDTDKGLARYISKAGGSSTLDITDRGLERPKHAPFIELDDMPRSAHSATDALDRRSLLRTASFSGRPVPLEPWLPSTPEEDTLMPHIFTVSRQGSTTSTNSDRAPSAFNIPSSTEPYSATTSAKGEERNRILTPEQQWSAIYRARDRRQTTSHTHIEASASALAFEWLDENFPPLQKPLRLVAPHPRSVVPATRYSRSSGSPSSAVSMGYSYSSDSIRSTVPMGHSHFPSSSQLTPPSASRPIAIKKLFSLGDDGFQSSPSPRDWDVPSRSPYETHEFSHSPQTPDSLPRSWQSSNLRARPPSQDMHYGHHHVHQYDDVLDDWEYDERRLHQWEESFRRREEKIYLREQELKKREDVILAEEAKQKEEKPGREEDEANRAEDKIMYKELEVVRQGKGEHGEGEGTEREKEEIKRKEKIAKEEEKEARKEAQGREGAEDLGRREEPAAERLEEEERHVLRKPGEAKRQEDEVTLKERASPTKEEKIRRKEEELARREEELSRREAEANLRHDQQQLQQAEFRKHVEEIRRQSMEEKTKQGLKSWGYHPRRTSSPPRMSTPRSVPSSIGPRSISNHDGHISTASPPANRGRSTSISTSRSSTTWTSSTQLSSTTDSWRSNIPKLRTPSAQKNQSRQVSLSNNSEFHMSTAGNPTADRGRTCTSRSNATWSSSSRLSSNASSHLPSTPNPQTSPAYKSPPCQMSTPKSSSSSAGPRLITGRNESSATNSHRNRSASTSPSRSNTPWTFTRLSSITRSQSSSTPKLQTPSPQKSLPSRISSRSASFSTIGQPMPKRNDLHIPATSSPTHKSRSKSTSVGHSSSAWTYSTRPIPSVSSQPSIRPKSQTPLARQNKKVASGTMEAGIMKEDNKDGEINWRETLARKEVQEVGKETQVRNGTDVVRPEEGKVERHIAQNLSPRSEESSCKEEARLEACGAVHVTEEEILKEGQQLARGKECNKQTPHNSGNTLPYAQSLLNTSTSPSSETTTEEEVNQELPDPAPDSLKDLTNELQRRSRYPIASGGFGDIWKCDLVNASGTIQVAVKTIRSFQSDSDELTRKNAKRVRRELKVWGRFKHHSILPLYGVATDFGPHPAMICPWADNGPLTRFLERQQDVLSSQDKFSLLNDIALGLQYLHNESVIHGDLTGSNVLINGDGRACLADFGLSTIILEFIGTSYFTSSIRGNVRWVAAELCEAPEDDEVLLSSECDIYSFGSITLQVLTCKVPYYNVKNDIAVLGQVMKGKKPEPPKESQIAPGHWEFIQRCWLPRASRPSVGEIVAFVGCEQQALLNRSTGV